MHRAGSVAQVMTSPSIGYQFFIDSAADLKYSKTTDGGATWGAAVNIRTGTLSCFVVWYDKWTPGDNNTKIHIAYLDANVDDVFYQNLETASDTLGGEVTVFLGASFTAIAGDWDQRCVAITKARGGNLGILYQGDGVTEFGFFRSVDGGANWVSKTDTSDTDSNWFLLFPANTSDPQDIMMIVYHSALTLVRCFVYDDSANTWASTSITIDPTLTATYFQMAATIRSSDSHIFATFWTETDTATADLRVYELNPSAVGGNGVTVTARTDVITNTAEYCQCGIFIDYNTGYLYVCYLGGGTWGVSGTRAFYKVSTDGGVTWSAQQGPVDATASNKRAIFCSLGGTESRFILSWVDTATDDLVTNFDNSLAVGTTAGPFSYFSPDTSETQVVVDLRTGFVIYINIINQSGASITVVASGPNETPTRSLVVPDATVDQLDIFDLAILEADLSVGVT